MNYKDYFKGKRITVIGLGVLGRGVGDTAFLSECGAELIVTDLKPASDLEPSLRELKGYENIHYVLGEHRKQDFRNRDMVLKSAGVPLDSPYIREAEKNSIPVVMSASLVATLADATIIGITGTRGKSTVTELIHHILVSSGKRAYLAGNVRGIATLPVLHEARKGDFIVMELDSWQLQGFHAASVSPHISVFTTFFPDHMTYYGGNMQRYFSDKAAIFQYQTANDVLVVTPQVQKILPTYFAGTILSETIVVEPHVVKNPALLGEHNMFNIACALSAAEAVGISHDEAVSAAETFPGVEGRLQFVREVRGVKIYNDNNATSPEATIAALKALKQNIILIMGGTDKGLSMKELLTAIPKHCKAVVLYPGSGTETITDAVKKMKIAVTRGTNLKECVDRALAHAKSGDSVLFSPAFSSFGKEYKNEYDRNDQFLRLIERL